MPATKLRKPKIKLNTMWVLDDKFIGAFPPSDKNMISDGIWMAKGVEEVENKYRVYDMYCASTNIPDLKVGDNRKVLELQLMWFCHEVVIKHRAKIKLPARYTK